MLCEMLSRFATALSESNHHHEAVTVLDAAICIPACEWRSFGQLALSLHWAGRRHAAVCMKVVSGTNNVTRPGNRETMRAGRLQSDRHRVGFTVEQQRPHSIYSAESHASRSTGSENAIGQFLPKPCIRSVAPNLLKLPEPLPNLFASRSVSGHHSFNCNGFWIALHSSLSIPRFYEPA